MVFAVFKNFIHSQLLKPIFCSRTVVKLRLPKIITLQNRLLRSVIWPFAVKLFLLPFSSNCSTQNIGFSDSGRHQTSATKLRSLRSSAFCRAPTLWSFTDDMCQELLSACVLVHDFGMLFLLWMKRLWLRICSLFYRRIVCDCDRYKCEILNVKFVVKYCNECYDLHLGLGWKENCTTLNVSLIYMFHLCI